MPIKTKYYLMIPVVLLFGALFAWADQGSGVSDLLTKKEAKALEATANTPEEHMKLATYYREQARRLDEKVRYHRDRAEMYLRHSFPLDGKMGVPMWRRCDDWASQFAEEEQRSIVLAKFHAAKAFGSEAGANAFANAFAQPARRGLLTTASPDKRGLRVQATPEQSSLFSNWTVNSSHFYDQTRISTYLLSAKGQPAVELSQLQNSAAALFDAQQRFLETLTETQRVSLSSHLHAIEKLHHDIEKRLNRLATGTASPASTSYFNTVNGLKRDLEGWKVEQQEIANRLGIQSQEVTAER